MLSYNAGFDQLEWTWSDPDPHHWDIESSADGISGWSIVDQTDGSDRSDNQQTDNAFARIIGRDSGGVAVTGYSNIVATV